MSQSSKHFLGISIKFDGSTEITGDTKSVQTKDGAYISRIQVDQGLDSPDYFSISLQMMTDAKFLLLDSIKPGTDVEINMGYEEEVTLFRGEVSYLEPSFQPEVHLLTIGGFDKVHRLTRGTSSRTWGDGHEIDQDAQAIASEVVNESVARKGETSDALTGEAETSEQLYEYISQLEVNDYHFLRGLGSSVALNLDSLSHEDAGKLLFRKKDTSGEAAVVICREKQDPPEARLYLGADFRMSTVQQLARVEVRGWDPKTKEPILGFCEAVSEPFEGTTGPAAAGQAHYGSSETGRTLTIVDVPVSSQEEADLLATSIFDQQAMDFLTADVLIEGVPSVGAGDVVELKQFGTRFSGRYLVQSSQHLVQAGAKDPYTTRLQLVRNAAPEP